MSQLELFDPIEFGLDAALAAAERQRSAWLGQADHEDKARARMARLEMRRLDKEIAALEAERSRLLARAKHN